MKTGLPLIFLTLFFLSFLMAGSNSGAEQPEFEIVFSSERKDKVTVQADPSNTIVDITSETGIGKATLKLSKGDWPEAMTFHLHLGGLEGFILSIGEKSIDRFKLKVQAFDKHGKPFPEKYLLKEAGYYEVKVPGSAFVKDLREIEIQWIDFYR